MHNYLINKYPYHRKTCSIRNIEELSFTFIRDEKYIGNLDATKIKNVVILVPEHFKNKSLPKGFTYEYVSNVSYVFTMVHNKIHKDTVPLRNIIDSSCIIHPTALVGVEGIHYIRAPDDSMIQMKHIGNVVIKPDVSILAFATIQRGVFGATFLDTGVKIDSHVNIGHNSYIGENTVIALGAIIGGSTTIGSNCMVGLGAIIRNGTFICDNVIVGQGANVVSNITNPGIYMGSPAKFFKPYNREWNF